MSFHNPDYVEISVHIHASESEEKVLKAIKNILPNDVDIVEFKVDRDIFKGHHGNPIIRLELKMRGKRKVRKIFENIFEKLTGLRSNGWIKERFDGKGNKLYLRLDKQLAYLGEIRLTDGDDVIRVVFSFPGYSKIPGDQLEKEVNERFPSE